MKTTKINGHKAAPYIAQRIDFTSHGALSSRTYTSDDFAPNYYGGQLPREHLDALIAAHKAGTVYVVFSYETPIAWYSEHNNTWTIPNVKYSITTTQHQGQVYLGASRATTTSGTVHTWTPQRGATGHDNQREEPVHPSRAHRPESPRAPLRVRARLPPVRVPVDAVLR